MGGAWCKAQAEVRHPQMRPEECVFERHSLVGKSNSVVG